MPGAGRPKRTLLPLVLVALWGGAAFLALGMGRGVLLSADILPKVWPWGGVVGAAEPAAPALSDPVWQFVPWLELARKEILAGRLPLWNPHQDAGVPLLGNSQSALGSPLVWPVLAAGTAAGWNLSLLLRILLAAVSAAAWLKEEGFAGPAQALGAATFSLSGAFVAWLEHPQTLSAAPAPLVLLFARRVSTGGSPTDLVGLAGATFLVLAGGHPETSLMVALLAAASLLVPRPGPRGVVRAVSGALLGVGLAAPLLLPFVEYFLLSAARAGEGRHVAVVPVAGLWRFLSPGAPVSHPIEGACTVSVLALLLAAWGLLRSRGRGRFLWAAVGAVILLVAFEGPAARLVARSIPVYWSRALLLLPLPVAWLAARGLDDAASRIARAGGLQWAAPAVAGLELLLAARGVHAVVPAAALFPSAPILERLKADPDTFRILPLHSFLPANSATMLGLYDLRGYDAIGPAAFLARREEVGKFRPVPVTTVAVAPWDLAPGGEALSSWNVKYLLLHPQFAFSAATLNEKKGLDLEEVYSGPDGKILLNRRCRPRVRLEGPGDVTVHRREPSRWEVETRAQTGTVLVVADAAFPGWTATLDGRALETSFEIGAPFRLNVPGGRHRVVLRYAPASFSAGLAAAGFSALVLGALLARGRRPPAGTFGEC